MHYTSWDRTDRAKPVLLVEEGPAQLAVFSGHQQARVGEAAWELTVDVHQGTATATWAAGGVARLQSAAGVPFGRAKRVDATVAGRTYTLVNESATNWVILDAADLKVAQFSGRNSGVRKAILELVGEDGATVALPPEDVVALSWFARLLLEERTGNAAIGIIATLVLASVVALAALFI